jgi:hypothetical protein
MRSSMMRSLAVILASIFTVLNKHLRRNRVLVPTIALPFSECIKHATDPKAVSVVLCLADYHALRF